MKTNDSAEILQKATIALRHVLKKKPSVARKLRPCGYLLETQGEILDTNMIAFFRAWPGGIVAFKNQKGEITLGLYRLKRSEGYPFTAGRLFTKIPALPKYVKNWLIPFHDEKYWIEFIRDFRFKRVQNVASF